MAFYMEVVRKGDDLDLDWKGERVVKDQDSHSLVWVISYACEYSIQDMNREFHYILHKHLFWLKELLIKILWTKVKGQCGLAEHISGHNSQIHPVIMT